MKTVYYLLFVSVFCLNSLSSTEEIYIGENMRLFTIIATDNDHIYACGVTYDNHFLTDSYHTFILKSTDYGDTWEYVLRKNYKLVDPSYYLRNSVLHLFSTGNDTIFAFAEGGLIYKSYDAGSNWDSVHINYVLNGKKQHIADLSFCRGVDNNNFKLWAATFQDQEQEMVHTVYSNDFAKTWHHFDHTDMPPGKDDVIYPGYISIPNDSLVYYTKQDADAYVYLNAYNVNKDSSYYINQIPDSIHYFYKFINDSTALFYGTIYNSDGTNFFPSCYKTTDRGTTFFKYFEDTKKGDLGEYEIQNNYEYLVGYNVFYYKNMNANVWNEYEFEYRAIRDMVVLKNNMVFITDTDDYIYKIENLTSVEENKDKYRNTNQIAKSSLFLNFNKKDNYNYKIYDLRGKEKHSGTLLVNSDFLTFDVSYLQNGTYIIVFKDSKGQVSDNVVFIKE